MEVALCLKDCRYTCCGCGCEDWDRLLDQVMAEVRRTLPAVYLSFLNDPSLIAQWRDGCQYDFPELTVSPAVYWTEDEKSLLSFTTQD
ncbi:hypothetical protein AOLI_G00226520 [Acnodon oligacanthus]